jgi:hypothetical protein
VPIGSLQACASARLSRRYLASALGLSFLVICLASPSVRACECLWQGSFSEVAKETDIVVLASIEGHRGNAADIVIEETYQGPGWHENLRVWMKAGDYCRPDIDSFPEGSRWILALHKIEALPEGGFNPSTPNISFGRIDDYSLSSCGGYWLKVSGQRASGNLIPGMPRFADAPKMNPVLVSHIASFIRGEASLNSLIRASEIDPELEALKRASRGFMRRGGLLPPTEEPDTSSPDNLE